VQRELGSLAIGQLAARGALVFQLTGVVVEEPKQRTIGGTFCEELDFHRSVVRAV